MIDRNEKKKEKAKKRRERMVSEEKKEQKKETLNFEKSRSNKKEEPFATFPTPSISKP